MASDYLLQLEGIPGESRDERRPNSIEIMSFSWGCTNSGAHGAGGGGGAGKVVINDFQIMKTTDKSSPQLFIRCCQGTHIPQGIITVRRGGGSSDGPPSDFMQITLTDIMVSSFDQNGSSGGVPTESISFSFSKIEFKYYIQQPTGQLSSITAWWDVKNNRGGIS